MGHFICLSFFMACDVIFKVCIKQNISGQMNSRKIVKNTNILHKI